MRKISNPNEKESVRAIKKRIIASARQDESLWDKLSYNDASVLYGALNIYLLDRNLPNDVQERAESMKASLKVRLKKNGKRNHKITNPSIKH